MRKNEMEKDYFNKISTAHTAARSGRDGGAGKRNGYSYLQYSWKINGH